MFNHFTHYHSFAICLIRFLRINVPIIYDVSIGLILHVNHAMRNMIIRLPVTKVIYRSWLSVNNSTIDIQEVSWFTYKETTHSKEKQFTEFIIHSSPWVSRISCTRWGHRKWHHKLDQMVANSIKSYQMYTSVLLLAEVLLPDLQCHFLGPHPMQGFLLTQ